MIHMYMTHMYMRYRCIESVFHLRTYDKGPLSEALGAQELRHGQAFRGRLVAPSRL